MPDALRFLAYTQDDSVVIFRVGERDEIMDVRGEPGVAGLHPSADGGAIVVKDDIFAIHPAGESRASDLYLRVLVSGDASVGDGDSPRAWRR
jgi:hypothetical protein